MVLHAKYHWYIFEILSSSLITQTRRFESSLLSERRVCVISEDGKRPNTHQRYFLSCSPRSILDIILCDFIFNRKLLNFPSCVITMIFFCWSYNACTEFKPIPD
jgi:hypothetical protein